MIKGIFFDIDGTLYSHEMEAIPDSVWKAFEELHARGIKLMTCTGRSLYELEEMKVTDLPFDGHVLLSGQLCLGKDNEVVFANPLNEHDIKLLREIYDNGEITVAVVEDDGNFVNFIDDDFARIQSEIHNNVYPIREHIQGNVYQISLYGKVEEKLQKYFSDFSSLKVLWWWRDAVDMITDGEGKAAGMKAMMDYYGFENDEIMAFGDSNNDRDMMKFANLSVCMGNGTDEIKAISSYVTDACYDDGIYKALKHFEII